MLIANSKIETWLILITYIFFKVLPGGYSESKIIRPFMSLQEKNSTLNPFRQLMQHCFIEDVKTVIFLRDESDHDAVILSNNFFHENTKYLFGTNNNSVFEKNKRIKIGTMIDDDYFNVHPIPSTNVIIVITSTNNFTKVLQNIRDSIWWNHEAKFLLVNENVEIGCQNAKTYLKIAWTFKLLSIIYACNSLNNQTLLFTYNPYSSLAPDFWNKTQDKYSVNLYWTMLQHSLEEFDNEITRQDNKFCANLYFDKTRNLHQYNLKLGLFISENVYRYNPKRVGYNRCIGMVYISVCDLLRFMNATMTVKRSENLGSIDSEGRAYGPIKDVLIGTSDILMIPVFIRDHWKWQNYPFFSDRIQYVTRKKSVDYKAMLLEIFHQQFWIFTIASFISSIITLKIVFKQSFVSAILEFLRIFISHSTLKNSNKTGVQIFLMALVWSVFIINSLMQSNLSAIFTTPGSIPAFRSVSDLIKSNISMYGCKQLKSLVDNEKLKHLYHYEKNFSLCVNRLKSGMNVACLCMQMELPYYVQESSAYHVAKYDQSRRWMAYTFQEDSPFISKSSKILLYMNEGGIIKFHIYMERHRHPKDGFLVQSTSLQIDNMSIGLWVLLVGWMSAFAAFFIEITLPRIPFLKPKKSKKKNINQRNQLWLRLRHLSNLNVCRSNRNLTWVSRQISTPKKLM